MIETDAHFEADQAVQRLRHAELYEDLPSQLDCVLEASALVVKLHELDANRPFRP